MASQPATSFDRVADVYDETRTLSAEAERATVELLAAELAGRPLCLEIGVGTGRFALPLHRAGVAMAGLDVSAAMLARLAAKAGGAAPFPVVRADAVRLPFRDRAFGAALCAYVLHLVPRWRAAVGELARVLGRGGVVVVTVGDRGCGLWRDVQDRFAAAAGRQLRSPGALGWGQVSAAMTELGARERILGSVDNVRTRTVGDMISLLERGAFSFTWDLDDGIRRRAGAEVRAWAEIAGGGLDRIDDDAVPIEWRAYDL